KICVYGDYDVDGITSTALLVSTLQSCGATVLYHVPDRFTEGYGMNSKVVQSLVENGVKLILTCDCGISNLTEVQIAKDLGLQVIITDHHLLPAELPAADCVINPGLLQPGHRAAHLAGVGVAYMFARGLLDTLGRASETVEFLDLVALGTVADVVPLRGENRFLLQSGLEVIRRSERPGIQALCRAAGLKQGELTESEIGFQLGPRLNSTGRLASARIGVELLLAEDLAQALDMAQKIDNLNKKRRTMGDEMLREAQAMLGAAYGNQPIVLYQPHWHHGIIGIIAGRLAELYGVPVMLMSLKEDGETVTGSARSIKGIHIYEVLAKCEQYLDKFGGHAGAAGFSLARANLEQFIRAVQGEMEKPLTENSLQDSVEHDLELDFTLVSKELHQCLNKLAPFGADNPEPVFLARGVQILSHRPLSGDQHLRLVLGQGSISHQAVWWWGGRKEIPPAADVLFTIGINTWQGVDNIQLSLAGIEVNAPIQMRETIELTIEDHRFWQQSGQNLPQFGGAAFYLEGGGGLPGLPVCNRFNLQTAHTLVLLSLPPDLRLLEELLAVTKASNLVLAYGDAPHDSAKALLQVLLGMCKFAYNKKQGLLSIPQAAVTTGHREYVIAVGLKLLKSMGHISYQALTPEEILVVPGPGPLEKDREEDETRFRQLLGEYRAFTRFLLNAAPQDIVKALHNSGVVYHSASTY
ncbi:MAG TPA: single-stranded-DNA-specific exonuclease RecJ, partial [Verrucomicrobiae bacterium]|nr:single-stranded-DNA-specific exonuclease RecJ [Verrucomicrobiae bacterium]